MPAQSEVSICNLALTSLSTSTIESLTQANENAKKCNAIYTFIRDNMLSCHNWNFARKEASLARTDETPVTEEWAYIYQLPNDCIRVVSQEENYKFAVFQDKLYNNETSSKIQYISRITDTQKFPTYFANALAAEIASILSFGITQNATLAQLAGQKAILALREAKLSDGQEGNYTNVITSSFITSRQG